MSTSITVTPAYSAQPAYVQPGYAQPAYAYAQPPVAQIQAQPPTFASSYTTGATLPQYGSLPAVVPAVRRQGGYRTNLGEFFRARGEYELYLTALKMDTPILHEARIWLNLPIGWDLSKTELEFHQVLKKRQLKKFKKEIIRLVGEQKMLSVMPPMVQNAVSAATWAPTISMPGTSMQAGHLPYQV